MKHFHVKLSLVFSLINGMKRTIPAVVSMLFLFQGFVLAQESKEEIREQTSKENSEEATD